MLGLEEMETFRIGMTGLGTLRHRKPLGKGKSEFMWKIGDWLR